MRNVSDEEWLDQFENDIEGFERMERIEADFRLQEAKEKLAKLSVAELRMLAVHYWSISKSEAKAIRKSELIFELAPELIEDDRV